MQTKGGRGFSGSILKARKRGVRMFGSLKDILEADEERGTSFWETVMEDDRREENISMEKSLAKMNEIWQAMLESDREYDEKLKSASGLTGTDAAKIGRHREDSLCSEFGSRILERALRIAESNACMKRIVAAPTAGSSGVVPAVLISMQERYHYSDEYMVRSLYVAAGIGGVIAVRASLSGAEGGCQAEIGSASAMAAGAAVFLRGGTDRMIADAAAIALSGLMGLVCDPVAGLVEVPCVKRNPVGAFNAIAAAEMALSGITSRIPPDEVIDAMKSVGHLTASELRETGKGGLAATPTGREISRKLTAGSPAAAESPAKPETV